jgi:flavin-dependent dehydrogenase
MSAGVVVVGGGLAGAAAACRLAAAGRRATLLERERGPSHKVCGEFISGEAEHSLAALGLAGGLARLGACPIERMRLVAGGHEATTSLPFAAWGLSRRRLDAWVLGQARRRGADVRLDHTAKRLTPDGDGWRVDTAKGPLAADAVLIATGKHDLRGWPRGGPASALIGLKLHVRLAASQALGLRRHVELALFEGGYAGLVTIEGGLANVCLVVSKNRFATEGRDWRRLVMSVPHLARRLAGSVACWERPLAVYRIPYGHLHRDGDDASGVYRVGDQAAVIPSFTGDGMAMALRSAERAVTAVLQGEPADLYHRRVARSFAPTLRLAGMVAKIGALPPLQVPLVAAGRLAPALLRSLAARTRAAAAA